MDLSNSNEKSTKNPQFPLNIRKFSRETLESSLSSLKSQPVPKTFSPEHKPISAKFPQNSEFFKNNANNSLFSKLNHVNFQAFFDSQQKSKQKLKETQQINRARVLSFHKKPQILEKKPEKALQTAEIQPKPRFLLSFLQKIT